jgi:hypothetical protein
MSARGNNNVVAFLYLTENVLVVTGKVIKILKGEKVIVCRQTRLSNVRLGCKSLQSCIYSLCGSSLTVSNEFQFFDRTKAVINSY